MNNHKRILSLILALVLAISTFTPAFAQTKTNVEKTRTGAQEVQIGDEIYYIFSTDKNAKNDLIKSQEKSQTKTEEIQTSDGLEVSDNLFGGPVKAAETTSYTLNIKGSNFKGVGGKTFDWDTLPQGLELQVWYLDENGLDVNVGNPININSTNYQDTITRTFDIAGQPYAFGMKTNVDTETYLTDVYYTNEQNAEPGIGSIDMTFDLVQVPSTKLDVKWVDVNQQPLARENTPATSIKDILTFNFIADRKFELPNQDKDESYFRLINKIKGSEVKDMEGATALVDGKKNGEEVTLDGKIYKLTTSYDPAYNKGSKIQLMYMPDVIDRTKNPESETPENYVRVTIDAGEGTKLAQGEKKKVYDVRVGKALKAEHYPKLEISDKAKYKEPITWTIAPGTVINEAKDIVGNAAKTTAEKITAANLKAVDTIALQGQELDEKFWHKGVALADNVDQAKKTEFEALLKEATVTDITDPARTTAEAGDKVGTLKVTFKDGSTLEVPKQKLIVKPNTVTVAFDKAQGKEHPLRDGDTTVKGKISASSKSDEFPVSLDGALVTIKKGDTVLSRTLAKEDGSFVAGVKDPLVAGEDISVVVTLPQSKTESAPVTEKVQLNPDKLNSIIPTGEAVVKNLKGKKGVDQTKVATLEAAIQKAYDDLVEKAPEGKKQENQKVKSKVEVSPTGQKSLDDQYDAIKKAIEDLTSNNIPEIKGEAYKEIFKGDALDLNKVVVDVQKEKGKDYAGYVELIDDDNVKANPEKNIQEKIDLKQLDTKNKRYYQLKVEKQKIDENTKAITWENVDENDIANINKTAGTYKVTYFVEDNFGANATHVMTLVVKEPVIEVPGEFPTPTPKGYVKVEFKSGDHSGLQGTSKYLVKKDSAKDSVKVPTIVPEEGWKIDDPAWTKEVPAKFESDFETTARVLEKVKTTEPEDKDRDKYATVEFKAGDHGTFEKVDNLDQITKFWVLKDEKVTFNVPTVTEADNYKFTGWDNKVQASYKTDTIHTATYKEKVVTKDPKDTTNYAKLTFEKGDHGKFGANAQTTLWVLKDTEVTFNAPNVIANKDFTFDKWDPEIKKSYSGDQTHTAKYTSDKNVSDVPVAGFQEVKFTTDVKDGKFVNEKSEAEKSVWVRPNTLVDLTDKAPSVTVTNNKKAFTGWSQKLIAEFAKADQATEIKAVYKDKVLTEEPKDKTGYAEVKFVAGNHGTFANAQEKTTFWVLKNEEVTFKVPTVTAKDGYTFKAWDPEVKKSYSEDQTHTATYKTNDSISDTPVEGFQEVKFLPGTDGKFEGEKQEKSVWVEPGVLVDLRAKAPKVTANEGKVHTGWNKELVAKFEKSDQATEITAQYKDKVVKDDPKDPNYVKVEFVAGEHGTFEKQGGKEQTTKFWVYKNEEVTFNAPTVTPADKYSFIGWKEPVQSSYNKDTTHTAQYSNTISDKYVEGWTEITFNSGDHGRFVADAKTVKWVDPKADVKLADMVPEITPDTNYSFKAWNNGTKDVALNNVSKYAKATTFTATYESDISDTPKDGFVKVTFAPGDHGKFVDENGKTITAEVTTNVRKDVTVDLREKAPKVMPNTGYGHTGWKIGDNAADLAKVNVKAETTITAQYKEGTFNKDAIKEITVLGPTKMGYGVGEKLDLTGLKVIAKDDAGLQRTYEYDNGELVYKINNDVEKLGATIKVADTDVTFKEEQGKKTVTTELAMEDNGKHIVVTKGTDPNKVEGQTETTLTIHENKSAKAENVKALNQNKVVDGKVTNEPKDTTTVTGKATPGSTVIIKNEAGDQIGKVEKVPASGEFTAEVTKQDPGKKVKVVVTEPGKQPSDPAEATVARDANNDGKADDDANQKTPTPTAKALNQGTEPTATTITGKAEANAKVVAKVGDTVVGEAIADAKGDYKIEATKTGKTDGGALGKDTEVKVTAQVEGKLVSDPTATVVKIDKDGNGVDDEDERTERPAALASNIGKTPAFTTITGEAEKGATVTAKVGNEVVGTATADKETGKYTIQAKQNEKPIKEGVKIDVTATLAPKTESLKQTVVVFKDTDETGQPDSAKDFDVKKAIGMQVVASPDKMVYNDGDKLNLDGLKVLVTDVNGNQKIFTYKHDANTEFTNAGLSVDLKQETVLSSKDYNAQTAKDGHNGRKLVVTLDTTGNTSAEKAITGETPTALTVNKNQSAQPTDVVAANQGDATVTKVKGKATKDAEIKITDASGQSLLPEGTTIKADAKGDFTADLNNLLDPGTKVFVTATEPGKSESPKAETSVIRDKDGNWKPDTGAKLSTPVIDPIREKDEKVVVAAPTADDKIQTITVEDQNGKTVTLTKDPADTTGKTWIVEGTDPAEKVVENNEGKLEIPVKDKLPLNDRDQIKVTFKDGENPANEAFDKAPVQKASQTPKVDPVYTGDKNVKILDPTVADPTAKTIKVKVGENDTMVIEKQADNSWKVKNNPNANVVVKDGKVIVPLDPAAKLNDKINVTTINDSKIESAPTEVKVVDKEKSTTPEVKPVATNDTKITGKAGPNADVVITITPKNGGEAKEIVTKADKEGNFTVPADGLKDGDTIVAKATEKDKAPAESAPVTVGVDKSKLIKAIDDGDKKLEGKDPKDYTPADKKLKEAIEEGKKVKDNPDASQNDVNEKTKAIEDAIKEKEETDKALDELKKAKEELDKTIKDARDDRKPREEIKKGQDSSKDAGTVIDKKGKDKDGKDMTSDQIKELVEKTKEADRRLKLPVIQVAINTAVNDGQNIIFTTNPGRCKVTVTILRKDRSKEIYTSETGAGGTGSLSIEKPLETGDSILIKATRITDTRLVPDYLDNYTSTGV